MPSDDEGWERVADHRPIERSMDDEAPDRRIKAKPKRAAAANTVRAIGPMLLRARHLRLALWLAATLVYGTAAGTLLQPEPVVAGLVMTAVWVAAIWGPLAGRRYRHRRARR